MKFNTKLIDDYLEQHNITKKEFCKLCKISFLTLEKLYSNDLDLLASEFLRVIKVLGVLPSELLFKPYASSQ